MKKVLLTAVVAFSTLIASAQFMVVTTYDDDQEETIDKITANLGIGYMINDDFTVGLKMTADDHEGHDHDAVDLVEEDEDNSYALWARYNLSMVEGAYVALEMPTEDATDNMNLGLGFSFSVWDELYIEPSYMMPANEDDNGDREGSFNLGVSYRF